MTTTTKPVRAGRGVLPAELTSFVGRRRELAETRRLLAQGRMLTLTGFGGVGKTRLAMKVATELRRTFADGVWFVDLTSLHDPQLLPHTVANTLELRQVSANPAADLATYLEDLELLLVLDNCEHLSDACAILSSKLLAAAPGLTILATSRHVLGVEGEQILAVPPLSTPDEEVRAGDASHYEAVQLFLDRASAVSPDFAITDANRAAVVELCRRLDGIPLAIELSAVWLRTLSPAQILDRLADRFRLLSSGRRAGPARQQALDATVGWSYDLCSPAEQLMWARLSVFSAGFDLEGAEQVCDGDGIARDEVLNVIASLVNKSVVIRHQATEHTTAWYQMLETVRQYGSAQLEGPEEVLRLRNRHRDHYRALAARYEAESFGPEQGDWFIRLRREHGNLRASLDFCLEHPGSAAYAFDIAAPIWNFWFAGFLREGYRFLLRALELAPAQTHARARALWAASYLAMFATEFDREAAMIAECEEIAAGLDDPLLDARIKECRGHATLYQGDLPGAVALLEQACAEFRAIGDGLGEFDTLILLTAAALFTEDPRIDDFARQAYELADRHGALSSKAYGLWSLGVAQWRGGDLRAATASLRESVRLFLPMQDLTGISFGIQALSWCAAFASPDVGAARLLGASQAAWRTSGAKVDETNAYGMFDTRAEDAVREALGEAAFDQAFAEGASYSFDQAVALALGEGGAAEKAEAAAAPQASATGAGSLTRREREVAMLLAEGLSNREIADRLVISLRTAETHVDHILGKLGLTSRALVASWVAEHHGR
ncbi:ATP-binding protein [Nocardioides pocheonensis]|uniref:LuxR family transcriptional regulator n=1 Tax=Nocardioides pocheonensis TaxID=661485 RepID=A0A3N0GKF5_9ACTN|nr:LuxR C-terminal-related transcriptional regulator [Nocardioides pocheonensis]RNM12550.1 LuxR family transcriptional regulator [Nocardioides pocheonensis]